MIPKIILFCTDFSDNSSTACDCARDYAKSFGASLFVIHVLDYSGQTSPAFRSEFSTGHQEAYQTNVRDETMKALEQIRLELVDQVKDVTTYLREGVPSSEILKFAEEYSVDLIVLGTHGWTGFKHLIMGSTAENVVRMAKCPVLTVKPPDAPNLFF